MSLFFDLDQIPAIEASCGHDTLNLICPRRLLKFLIVATKSFHWVKNFSAAWAIEQGWTTKKPGINERYIDVINVRFINSEFRICRTSAWAELEIQSNWALWVWKKWTFLENENVSDTMNSFFDFDEIFSLETSCAHYTLNLICGRSLFKFWIAAPKSSEGKQIQIFEKNSNF